MDGYAGLNTPDGVPIRANFKGPIAYRRGRGHVVIGCEGSSVT